MESTFNWDWIDPTGGDNASEPAAGNGITGPINVMNTTEQPSGVDGNWSFLGDLLNTTMITLGGALNTRLGTEVNKVTGVINPTPKPVVKASSSNTLVWIGAAAVVGLLIVSSRRK